jgi:hypothetical protein
MGEMEREVELASGTVGWLPAQTHHGENIGDTPTHVVFVELKDAGSDADEPLPVDRLGPQ